MHFQDKSTKSIQVERIYKCIIIKRGKYSPEWRHTCLNFTSRKLRYPPDPLEVFRKGSMAPYMCRPQDGHGRAHSLGVLFL